MPQYENLNIPKILAKAKETPRVADYLMDDRDMHRVPRQWLVNVAYTLIGDPFNTWVTEQIAQRNHEIAQKQKLLIDMDPAIALAFNNSVNISSKYIICDLLASGGDERRRNSSSLFPVHSLIFFFVCSFQGRGCPSPQARLQEAQDPGRDE